MKRPRRLLVLTGEVSGDMHAAGVIRALRAQYPDLAVSGTGGDALRNEGVEVLYDVAEMAVVGGTEAAAKFFRLRRIFLDLLARTRAAPPDAVLLVDYPGFNLRFAQRVHAMGIRTVFYICPQVWAWRRSRIPSMTRCLDRLITIFPFEPVLFDPDALRVDFAGHPLTNETRRLLNAPAPELPWQDGVPRIALLPGSRPQEIQSLMPVLWPAAARIEAHYPGCSFILAAASEADAARLVQFIERFPGAAPQRWQVVSGMTRQVLHQADAAVVASGTATLEAAFLDCPTVIAYRTGRITYALGRRLMQVRHIGIVNILANREVCPELLQNDCRPDRIASALIPLAADTLQRRQMRDAMRKVVAGLGDGDAYENAATIVAEEIEQGVALKASQ